MMNRREYELITTSSTKLGLSNLSSSVFVFEFFFEYVKSGEESSASRDALVGLMFDVRSMAVATADVSLGGGVEERT
jgi:hypothetical protein